MGNLPAPDLTLSWSPVHLHDPSGVGHALTPLQEKRAKRTGPAAMGPRARRTCQAGKDGTLPRGLRHRTGNHCSHSFFFNSGSSFCYFNYGKTYITKFTLFTIFKCTVQWD